MIRLGRGEFNLGRQLPTEEIEATVDAVTCEQVLSLAHELLAPANLGLCVLGPVKQSTIDWQRGEAVA